MRLLSRVKLVLPHQSRSWSVQVHMYLKEGHVEKQGLRSVHLASEKLCWHTQYLKHLMCRHPSVEFRALKTKLPPKFTVSSRVDHIQAFEPLWVITVVRVLLTHRQKFKQQHALWSGSDLLPSNKSRFTKDHRDVPDPCVVLCPTPRLASTFIASFIPAYRVACILQHFVGRTIRSALSVLVPLSAGREKVLLGYFLTPECSDIEVLATAVSMSGHRAACCRSSF